MTAETPWRMDSSSQKLTEQQFQQWCSLLEDRTGMRLPVQRKSFLETSLSIRMREVGCKSLQEYFDKIVSGSQRAIEWATLVDRLTVHETRFFRHPASYDLVGNYIADSGKRGKSIQAWSVGCSTGEEAYSLAITLNETLRDIGDEFNFGVTATDISMPSIATARKGIYSRRKIELIEEHLQEEYFSNANEREVEVVEKIRERICFAQMNVMNLQEAPFADFDIIYCQNVLIYFRRWRRKDILNGLVDALAVGGILILGVGEIVDWEHTSLERFEFENTLSYIKVRA